MIITAVMQTDTGGSTYPDTIESAVSGAVFRQRNRTVPQYFQVLCIRIQIVLLSQIRLCRMEKSIFAVTCLIH